MARIRGLARQCPMRIVAGDPFYGSFGNSVAKGRKLRESATFAQRRHWPRVPVYAAPVKAVQEAPIGGDTRL